MDPFLQFVLELFSLVLLIVCGVLYFLLRRALSVHNALTEANVLLQTDNDNAYAANSNLETWFEEFKGRIVYAYQRIKTIDAQGSFEADDEVGYFFKELKAIIERLYELGIMDETEKQEALSVTAPKITTEEINKILTERIAAGRETKG